MKKMSKKHYILFGVILFFITSKTFCDFTSDNIYNNYIEIPANDSYIEEIGSWQDLLIENIYLSWSTNLKLKDNLFLKADLWQVFYFQNKFDFLIKDKLSITNSWSETSFLYLNWKILNENQAIFWVYDNTWSLNFSWSLNFENQKYTWIEITKIITDIFSNSNTWIMFTIIFIWLWVFFLVVAFMIFWFNKWILFVKNIGWKK